MRAVILVSIALGMVWNAIVVYLMAGRIVEAFTTVWLPAGVLAGVAAGLFTIRSRLRRDGRESVADGIATYYLGMAVYWASFVVIERAALCAQHGGWTAIDLKDHLSLILLFLLYGTVWYGIVLIPLAFLSRYLLWKAFTRTKA